MNGNHIFKSTDSPSIEGFLLYTAMIEYMYMALLCAELVYTMCSPRQAIYIIIDYFP